MKNELENDLRETAMLIVMHTVKNILLLPPFWLTTLKVNLLCH